MRVGVISLSGSAPVPGEILLKRQPGVETGRVIRKNSCGLRYQLYLSQHMHRCEQSHGIVGEGFKNLVVVVKTERFFVQNI